MRGKKLIALLLTAIMALAIVPVNVLGYDVEERFTLGVWTSFFIWEPQSSGSYCTCDNDELPKGMAFTYRWDKERSAYAYFVEGTPQQVGRYDATIEFHPEGAMSSSIVIRFTIVPDQNEFFHFLRDEYKTSGTVGEYLWLRFPHSFNAADELEFGEYYNPGADNDDIQSIGLKILPEGVLCGTPKKAGTYKFWIYANAKYDGVWYEDYAKVTVKIESAPTPKPTAKPTATPKPTAKPTNTPKPTAKPTNTPKPTAAPTAVPAANRMAPDCVLEAAHDIPVTPGEYFEAVLISDAGSCTIGNLTENGAELPKGVSFENAGGKYVLRGVMNEEEFAEDYYTFDDGEPFDGVYTFFVPMSCDGLNYVLRYRIIKAERKTYPEAVPMTGFGE